jgi:hypothetical protein
MEEGVSRAKQDARPEYGGAVEGPPHQRLALCAGTDITRLRVGIGTDPRDVHESLDTCPCRLPRHVAGSAYMHRLKSFVAPLDIQADRVDDCLGSLNRLCHRGLIPHIGANRLDLPLADTYLGESGIPGVAHCHSHVCTLSH